jgi:hypothetical protein
VLADLVVLGVDEVTEVDQCRLQQLVLERLRDSERSGPSGLIWKISRPSGMKLMVVSGKTQWK